jgi:phosphoglycolate phosphatase
MTIGELADATIVFDLDGTLVDTAPDLVRALNRVMDMEGLPHLKLKSARTMVGQGARILIERAALQANVVFNPDKLDALTHAFIDVYRSDIARESRIYPNVEAALDMLAGLGAKLAVCTNKRTDLSIQLLEALGIAERFSAIVGADAVTNRKPHPDHLRTAVLRAGGEVRRAVMVGDTIADVGAARAAGAPVIVVGFGYSDIGAETLGADALIHSFSELAPVSRRLLAARP